MKQNLSKIYTIVVVLVLLILGGWSAWDIYRLRTSNSEAARVNVDQIKSNVESSYNAAKSFSDESFFRSIRQLFKDNPDLEILTVYSHDSDVGIEYHYNRGEDVELLNLDETTPLTMKDLPDYKYNQLMKSKLTSSLNTPGMSGMELDLIYKVVDGATIYNILIRLLIVVVVLFFTTLFMIFTVSRHNADEDIEDDDSDMSDHMDSSFDSEDSHDDLSLGWDENEDSSGGEFAMDDSEFDNLDLNSSGGDFDDLNLDDMNDDFDSASESSSDDFSFDESSDDFGNELNDELSLDEPFEDFNLEESSDDFESVSSGESELSEDTDDYSFDDVTDDFGDSEADELNLDEPVDDFNLEDASEDFNLDDNENEMSFDDLDDVNLDSDIPEEEDLMAMDHEISPSSDFDDDFDFDNIEDTFTDNVDSDSSENGPSLFSPKSGVGWEDFIEDRVNFELERAASEDQDLVLGLIQCDSLTEDNYKIFADQLKEDFNYPDLIFEYKDKGFALIVPNNDLDQSLKTLEAFTGREIEEYGEINVGISSRNGRLITGGRIFMEAENALHKAVDDPEKNIVGFRSDPDKFREFLSKK
ncbi:hypothetical protein [Spirochaeta isovalerica]|uniref:Preprotein translocase subunit SecG n=1 Tax=Spirochaeta isovalerica TaxID=150 RepID=A0A841R514_9SPIO|nr:hypothetical protein [Spirochaeta isovalerica]MBB6478906.1 preprotein translocase subunit SecG [Spirochaeta isovalerica]